MPRGLDHVVHVVRDLEAAGELYDLLGFTVGTRNRHPWGTHNRLIQIPGFFVELLEIADADAIPPHENAHFSFGAFNRDFLAECGPGLSMLVFEGHDPAAEKAEFDAAGFGGFDVFSFERTGRRPDGSDVEVGFSLAFARDPKSPQAGFFTCTQRRPENFWSPELQRHMNGTVGVAGAVLVSEEPAAHLDFIEAVSGVRLRRATDGWYVGDTPRGAIDLMNRDIFHTRFGGSPKPAPGLRIAAIRFAVKDIAVTRKRLASSRMAAEEIEGLIVVGPQAALGATLVFEPATS
ncbi:VOC family protein [Ancylobacter terrae]|uniref:VOC family protein n=1 Tax=Ancylobacter sp. sgz301288 TaxID=3342077 RepID=UPI00385E35CC